MTVETINKFVTDFLEQNCTIDVRSDLLGEWKSEDTQSELLEIMKILTKKTPTKKTPTKDPNRPKKNRSSYILFGMDHRPKAKDNLGDGAKPTEVSRELGRMWTELKESDKSDDQTLLAKYTAAAEADKERYAKEMEGYTPEEGDEKTPTKKTPTKDPNRPKKNRSSYILFGMDHRPKAKDNLGDGAKPADVSRELGRMWTELKESAGDPEGWGLVKSDDQALLAKYIAAAEADKERYAKEMEGYAPEEAKKTPTPVKKTPTPVKKTPTPVKKTRKLPDFVAKSDEKDPSTDAGVINEMFDSQDDPEDVTAVQLPSTDKNGKTLTTAYSVFKEFKYASAEKELGKGAKKTEITKSLASAWKKVAKADRAPYQTKADENKESA